MSDSRTVPAGLEPLLTTRQLADYLDLDVQAIYDLRCHHRGPHGIRVGRELRYRVGDIRAWLDSNTEHDGGER